MCVYVCVLASRWAILGPRAPFMDRSKLSLVVPTLPAFPPSRECHNPSVFADWPPTPTCPLPPKAPTYWGYLFRVGGGAKLMGPGHRLHWNPLARPVDGVLTRVGARAVCSILIPSTFRTDDPRRTYAIANWMLTMSLNNL